MFSTLPFHYKRFISLKFYIFYIVNILAIYSFIVVDQKQVLRQQHGLSSQSQQRAITMTEMLSLILYLPPQLMATNSILFLTRRICKSNQVLLFCFLNLSPESCKLDYEASYIEYWCQSLTCPWRRLITKKQLHLLQACLEFNTLVYNVKQVMTISKR